MLVAMQAKAINPALAQQLQDAPVVMNLARTLSFQIGQLADSRLSPDATATQREYVHDLTEMLRTIMCL
jgi:hypothetical protein